MSIVLTQCPVACPPCGGATCDPRVIPNPCTPAADPTTATAPVQFGSIILGTTATPLSTPLPAGGSVTIGGNALIGGPGSVNSSWGPLGPPSCWALGLEFSAPYPHAITIPHAGGGTYLQGTASYSYNVLNGDFSVAPFSVTVDASAGPNYTAWQAAGFAPLTVEIMKFNASPSCCCGWTTCTPTIPGGQSWQYVAIATYGWVFNSGTGLYDATMTATAQLECLPA